MHKLCNVSTAVKALHRSFLTGLLKLHMTYTDTQTALDELHRTSIGVIKYFQATMPFGSFLTAKLPLKTFTGVLTLAF